MFRLFKYLFLIAFMFGGWALAAASLHIVRSTVPEATPAWRAWIPNIQLVTKSSLGWKDTWVDTTKWTVADLATHPDLVKRLEQTGNDAVLKQVAERPAVVAPVPGPVTLAPATDPNVSAPGQTVSTPVVDTKEAPKKEKSIFDFGR